MEKKIAFVCEINKDSVKMYEWKNQLIEVKKTDFDDDIELGKFYELDENGKFCEYLVSRSDMKETNLKIFVKDGVVHAKDLAFAPSEVDLDTNSLSQYRNTAYSYRLQLLNDPNNLFFEFLKSEVAMATVKFAPTDKTVFEVVEVEEVPEVYKNSFSPLEYLTFHAPWNIIINERAGQEASKPRDEFIRYNRTQKISHVSEYIGVCIEKELKTFKNSEGQKIKEQWVHRFFSPTLGLVRAVDYYTEVGGWYNFRLNDTRYKNKRNDLDDHYFATTIRVSSLVKLLDQIPTKIVNKEFESNSVEWPTFTISFLLGPEMLESAYNSMKNNVPKRFFGLKKYASFYSAGLGKIAIKDQSSQEISQHIEEYLEKIEKEDPTAFEQWKDDHICVEVEVEPFPNYFSRWINNKDDKNAAFFFVTKVLRITYLVGGKLIYSNTK